MNTQPELQSVDQWPHVAIALQQPLAVLVESGPAFSVLVASRLSDEPDLGGLVLEDCLQIRIEDDGDCSASRFPRIAIKCESKSDYWVASPDNFDSLFSQTSRNPYAFVQLDKPETELFQNAVEARDFDTIFHLFRIRFGRLPRFYTPGEKEFRAPDNYATGRRAFPENTKFL